MRIHGYWTILILETIGAGIILIRGIPFYKFLLALTVVFSIYCYCRDLEELAEDFKIRK